MAASERHFCTVLHDVSPQTWDGFRPLIDRCDALGVPLTLLVIPDHHGQSPLARFPHFCAAVGRRLARGDEVALHGFFHRDDQPLRPAPLDWWRRRVCTHEAEFAALPAALADVRLQAGLALFRQLGWRPAGFVPPGWIAAAALAPQLKACGFLYTTSFDRIVALQQAAAHPAPVIVWSARSRPRRTASLLWSRHRLRRLAAAPLVRLAIHPEDMRHASAQQFWLDTVTQLAALRQPVTKTQWLETLREHTGPASAAC